MNTDLGDREMMDDVLSSQKHMTGLYNTFSNECVCDALRNDMLNILREEHNIQASVFNEMKKRDWYAPADADSAQVSTAKTKFSNMQASI